MDFHSSARKLLVLSLLTAVVIGFASVASATITITSAEIVLIGDEEGAGARGEGMVSIGDTIEVIVNVTDPDSVLAVVADMRKYGGAEEETLYAYQGRLSYISGAAWVPSCSITEYAEINQLAIHFPDSDLVRTEHWTVCLSGGGADAYATVPVFTGNCSGGAFNIGTPAIYDTAAVSAYGVNNWRVYWDSTHPGDGDPGGAVDTFMIRDVDGAVDLPTLAFDGTICYAENASGDTLFTFTPAVTAGTLCCNNLPVDCDYVDFQTFGAGSHTWEVTGNVSGVLDDDAVTDVLYYGVDSGDTLFSFLIENVSSGVCCNTICTDCDHFEFETWQWIPADSTWRDTLIVQDGGQWWIDNTPCDYIGHTDPSALITAWNILWPDSGFPYDVDTMSTTVPEDEGGNPVDYDTHHTTYAQLVDPGGAGAEFIEAEDYFIRCMTDSSGVFALWGDVDNVLNPTSLFGFAPDTAYAYLDLQRLSHANGNDDIPDFYFDAHWFGDPYSDTSYTNVDSLGWWIELSPWYASVDCPTEDNGVTGLWEVAFACSAGSTDVAAGEQMIMKWVSDSGDTTYFPGFSHSLCAIDNQIPDYMLTGSSDSVTVDDITFVADMDNAGNADVLNPISIGNPIADWLQIRIDLEGLFDLADVEAGGWGFADLMGIGFYMADTLTTPLGLDFLGEMGPLSPIWGTDSVDVVASPPSPYAWDQDSVVTAGVWIFDNAGNGWFVGPKDTALAIDNQLPVVPEDSCAAWGDPIYTTIAVDAAPYVGYADCGEPDQNIYGNDYFDRDKIVCYANLGDVFGADEIENVTMVNDPYCVGGIIMYDDGTLGDDPVADDGNYTGHARVEIGDGTTFCFLDSDEESVYFEVEVEDDAGNVAISGSCIGVKYDNELPTITAENVMIMFWDHPGTIPVDGDLNEDGIVSIGDSLIFEWRAEDETWDDMEIDSVRVDAASIDPTYSGWITLYWDPSGGVYRNYVPGEAGMPYEVTMGSIDGETLEAAFCVWDNAGNSTGWKTFVSDPALTLDNVGGMIQWDLFQISTTGPDSIASIGDTISFYYDGPDDDVVAIWINVDDVSETVEWLELTEGASWSGWIIVDPGAVDTMDYYFMGKAFDNVANVDSGYLPRFPVDNMPPTMDCANAWLRLWDYVDNAADRYVNIGDNLTACFWDVNGDVEAVTCDWSNYGAGTTDMVKGFQDQPELWGYRLDPVPENGVDQGPGGMATLVHMVATDKAGNSVDGWFCPIWHDEAENDSLLLDQGGTCDHVCQPVDTERPGPPDAGDITFELIDDDGNGVANVGDRLRIIVDMGNPTAPGYDMQWESAMVHAEIHQYGDDYAADPEGYLMLTDDNYSAGGEGDGRFSYFYFFNNSDGDQLIEGCPILPGMLDVPAGDDSTRIRVRSMDDAGNYSDGWILSDVLQGDVVMLGASGPVAVDNEIPEIDPEWITVTFVDEDFNGILSIGDTATVSVDMTDAPGNEVEGVWANLYDWGYPSMDMVALQANSPVYTFTWVIERVPGDWWIDGRLFEDELPEEGQEPAPPIMNAVQLEPEMEVVAIDASGNWSAYEWTGAPEWVTFTWGDPYIDDWPFMWTWTSSGPIGEFMADTDAPDPVNPTFIATDFGGSAVRATRLVDGRIGLDIFYDFEPRNPDVYEFYVYGDMATPGVIDWDTYLGEPVAAGTVPESGWGTEYEWVSDILPERDDPYNFGVLAKDNADNFSDPALTWIAGEDADATAPTGYVDVFNENDAPATLIDADGYFHGYINEPEEFQNVCYVEWYGRVKDLDKVTPGDQPSEWVYFDETGQYPPSYPLPDMPYIADPESLLSAVAAALPAFSYLECTDFEVCIRPWDEAGNHPTMGECVPTAYTYDTFYPAITWYSIGGYTDPWNQEFSNTEMPLVQVLANDACAATGELTYKLYLTKTGGQSLGGIGLWLDTQTLPVGEIYEYTWDLTNYPQGFTGLKAVVMDEAGNGVYHDWQIVVLDETAPEGMFATGDHPNNMVIPGQHFGTHESVSLYVLVPWMSGMPGYDVGEVRTYWRMYESMDDWTMIGTQTSYNDTTPNVGGYLYYDYEFSWDTSAFTDGDMIELKAEIYDERGNMTSTTIWVMINGEYAVLAMDVPEAMEVCGEDRVSGKINIVGTEVSCPWDTYMAFWMYKETSEPDVGDCGWDGRWAQPDTMFRTGVTDETIWRYTFDTTTLPDGSYDFMLCTWDIGDNWSYDQDHDWCVDAGAFAAAVANGMGMTLVVDNTAPEVRIVDVNCAGNVYQGTEAYVSCGEDVTVTAWTETTCDVARVEYYLRGSEIMDYQHLVGMSSTPGDYEVTFPASGDICDLLVPGALSDGFAMPMLVARVVDVFGNYDEYSISFYILNVAPTSAFLTNPAHGELVRHWVALRSDVIDADAIYDVTYQYQAVGSLDDWTNIAVTKPQMGDPWNLDTKNDTIYWRTEGVADGAYYLRAVARNENLVVDDDPPQIMVTVDNTPPVVTLETTPQYPEAFTGDAPFIGGPYVELVANATDANGVMWVDFGYRTAETDVGSTTWIWNDRQAPWAYMWDEDSGTPFPGIISGGYIIVAHGEDNAGNEFWYEVERYIDHCPPWGWVTQINDDLTPENSQFSGMISITGTCIDGAPDANCDFANWEESSGMHGAQFQYAPVDGMFMAAESGTGMVWTNLGGLIMGDGPSYTLNWDASFAVPGRYYLRLKGFDNVNNDAESLCFELPYIMIEILPPGPSTAQIAGYDNVSGWLVATAPTTAEYVRFEYIADVPVFGDEYEWTLLDQTDTPMVTGVYGVPVNLENVPDGDYLVRAIAVYPDGSEDDAPPYMEATVTGGVMTMGATPNVTEFERWGNINAPSSVRVGAVSTNEPTFVVLLDNDIPNKFNTPTAVLLDPENPDDPTIWVDEFSITPAGYHGNATILASHVDNGSVGILEKRVRTYRSTIAEGTKGYVSQDGMSIDIPSGAHDYSDGILMIHTPEPAAQPQVDEVVVVGQPVMLYSLYDGWACFDEGYTAHIKMSYSDSDIPAGGSEDNLRVARWNHSSRVWEYSGIFNVQQDTEGNELWFNASCMDLYAVVHTEGFRIADPRIMPFCNGYTGRYPTFVTIIEDEIHGVDPDDIKVTISGPADNPVLDNMIIWDDGQAAWGWVGFYDYVSNDLWMNIDDFEFDWDNEYGDDFTHGLPGGTYTMRFVALNGIGERKTKTVEFTVDAGKPHVELLGDKVNAHPVIELAVSDDLAGLDLWKICADMYIVERVDRDCCYDGYYGPVEAEERLGWVKPSSLKWKDDDEESGILLLEFGEIYYAGNPHGLSVDVVVYDCEHECQDGDTDCDDCLCYYMEHGIADCVGNHATPIWRRYTVDIYYDPDGDGDPSAYGIADAHFYPNPINFSEHGCGSISYDLNGAGDLTVKIFDFAGDYVATLYDGFASGTGTMEWCGQDHTGRMVGAGVYIGSATFDNGSAVVTRNFKIGVIR